MAALDRGRVQRLSLCPSRYASIRTLGEPSLVWLGAPDEILLFGLLRRCNLLSGLPRKVDQVRMAQSPFMRSEAHSGN